MMIREVVRSTLCLCKVKVALYASLSAVAGFVLAAHPVMGKGLALFAGVFLLACGACALNQYQERETDARMPRTASRPVPSGRIGCRIALRLSLALIGSGLAVLLVTGPCLLPLLGLSAILWYNGLYTWLKRKSAFAVIPGALIGAIPPAMGWIAGGSNLSDPGLTAVCFFFFMWQVPHFWLHLMSYGQEYSEAGLPSPTAIFTGIQMTRLVFQWISATVVSALLLCLYGFLRTPVAFVVLTGVSLWLLSGGIRLLLSDGANCRMAFREINVYMLAVILLIFLDTGIATLPMTF
jgi:protoheme IX farnesyltransferase